jgi:hypothetical protein
VLFELLWSSSDSEGVAGVAGVAALGDADSSSEWLDREGSKGVAWSQEEEEMSECVTVTWSD